MSGDDVAGTALAHRLRELRESHWPDVHVTQAQLREAFKISVPLISSWESSSVIKIPPLHRLEKYARFFATKRSVDNGRARLFDESELTPDEREEHKKLLAELTKLRQRALRQQSAGEVFEPDLAEGARRRGPWHFPRGEPITIICSQIPEEDRARIPKSDPDNADYVALYRYSDLDSLFELWGHVRSVNPHSRGVVRTMADLQSDDLTTHVVLLGGVDYNAVTEYTLTRIELPVRQIPDWAGEKGPYFEVERDGDTERYYPVTVGSGDSLRLQEDVAFFYRGVNPFNVERTLTICNGIYARGVYGAVRALTDARFHDRNAGYLESRFGDAESYSILMRVGVQGRAVITPDWTIDAFRLHEWPEPTHGD
ncbi:helix-turn-helix domain-containing protein [Nonomuraea turcica]|uniref:helix-turn-helix domain-containing protein n=1 Tax=Nonomuraea sp. G32 TaxID=3067274 RepID=UPI00273BAEF9|nr:helix-turn-helix transcriptional regulator [Nonomuraea sp. G32]MDP4504698.1 helix-turn-helix transcriptional regulator [Nonomuraea sp. G32]